jgi:hypothetical protein
MRALLSIVLSFGALVLWQLALAYVPDPFFGMMLGAAIASSIVANANWLSSKVIGPSSDEEKPETVREHLTSTAIGFGVIGLGVLYFVSKGTFSEKDGPLIEGFICGAAVGAIVKAFVLSAIWRERAAAKRRTPGVFLDDRGS